MSQLRERGVPARPLRLTEAAARPRSRPGKRAAGDGEKPVAPTLERAAVELALRSIHRVRAAVPWRRAALVALTGIDGSGKGHLASRILARLRRTDLRAVALGVDPWLNLPHVRFGGADPALHFYENALRQDEMFERLVLPLRDTRRCRLVADVAEETATTFRRQLFRFEDVDVVLLEGIFLLKPAYRELFDLSFWVDCSFETALERALTRRQEGLSPTATIRAYETIYFPAQLIHLRQDAPRAAATGILENDSRLIERGGLRPAAALSPGIATSGATPRTPEPPPFPSR